MRSLLGITFFVAGFAALAVISAWQRDYCDFHRWGWYLIVGLYYVFGLLARYGGRWMPLLVPLAVIGAGIAFAVLQAGAGTCGYE